MSTFWIRTSVAVFFLSQLNYLAYGNFSQKSGEISFPRKDDEFHLSRRSEGPELFVFFFYFDANEVVDDGMYKKCPQSTAGLHTMV